MNIRDVLQTRTYYKHIVTDKRVVFRTYGNDNVEYARMLHKGWVSIGRPERIML